MVAELDDKDIDELVQSYQFTLSDKLKLRSIKTKLSKKHVKLY